MVERSFNRRLRPWTWLALLLVMLFLAPSPGTAAERIYLFDVTASVAADGTVTVREQLLLNVTGEKIQHGIIRVFPTDYKDQEGRTVRIDFELVSARLNGRDVPWQTERRGASLEIRLGQKEVFLERGEHVYDLTYRTKGWLGFFQDHDELFWNVTGNDWDFPIDQAVYRILLPEGAEVTGMAAYTGRRGERGSDFTVADDGSVETTRTLAPGEGLSVAWGWNKGIVTAPSPGAGERLSLMIRRNRFPVMVLFWGLLFVYYFLAWRAKGKDPKAETVIPLFEPPQDIEPGFARYFRDRGYTVAVLAADLLHLAVKGVIVFEERDKTLYLHRGPAERGERHLSPPLQSLAQALERAIDEEGLSVTPSRGGLFSEFGRRLSESYESRSKMLFAQNFGYSLSGLLFFLPFIWLGDHLDSPIFADVLDSVLTPLLILISSAVVWFCLLDLRRLFEKETKIGKGGWVARAFGYLLVLAAGRILWRFLVADPVVAGGLVAASFTVLLFIRIMPVLTERGARLSEGIDGLRLFLSTAERHRLALLNPPEETPELFERLLPYALALDVAETWADSFKDLLEKARYEPQWNRTVYDADGFDRYGRASFTLLFARSLSENLRQASFRDPATKGPSGGSSGRGGSGLGGGFSGGGGGGGGGRGW